MALWACVQFYLVQFDGLSSWRGGGFGMYASFHPVQNRAWIHSENQDPIVFSKKDRAESNLLKIVRPHLTFRQVNALKSSINEIPARPHIEIFKLQFDMDSYKLEREKILDTADQISASQAGDLP